MAEPCTTPTDTDNTGARLRLVPATPPPDLAIRFVPLDGECLGWYDPDEHAIMVDPRQSRREMAETLLHELAHAMYGDGADLDDELHESLERWAVQSANLLDLVRGEAVAP